MNSKTIASFGWEPLDDTPYSPELSSSEYYMLLHLKKPPSGLRHNDGDKVKTIVLQWLQIRRQDSIKSGIINLSVYVCPTLYDNVITFVAKLNFI